jgi:hypothetical protein
MQNNCSNETASEFITTYWDEIVDSIERCAALAEELKNDELGYKDAA